MIWQLLWAPIRRRKSRALLSIAALALGACLITALLTLYAGVEHNLSAQFRRYGANLAVTPNHGATALSAAAAARVAAIVPDSVGVHYDVAQAAGQPIVVAGADLAHLRALNAEWEVTGPLPQSGQAWLGVNAAQQMHVHSGQTITVALNGRTAAWTVVGTVSAGTSEDNQILAPEAQVAALTDDAGYTTIVARVAGGPAAMTAALARLRAALPNADAQPIRQIAQGEGAILLSTRGMLLATSLLILLTVGLCVTSALTTLALERRQHFGLMKALGATETAVMASFVGEAAALALAAALVGIVAGGALAGGAGEALFHLWLWPSAYALAAAVLLTVTVASTAALLPWPIVHAAAPAAILRGE